MAKPRDPSLSQPTGALEQADPEAPTSLDQAQQDPGDLFGEGSFLLFDDEVGGIVNQALRDEWGTDQVKAALQQTNAFKEVADRRAALADPAGGAAARQELTWKVAAMLGRTPDDPMARDMTRRLEAGAATWSSLQTLVDPMQVGTPVSRVMELGAVHGLPIGEGTAAEYVNMPEAQVDTELAMLSQQLYPYKPAGAPWQRFAGIFADIHRAELGKDVAATDPALQAKIEQAQGNPGIFRQLLRGTPAWEESETGQRMFAERTDQLMHDLSFGEAAREQMEIQGQQYQVQEGVSAQSGGGMLGQPQGGSYGPGSGTSGSASGLQGSAAAGLAFLKQMFPGHPIGGWRATGSVPGSDHPKGMALDYMIEGNMGLGQTIASYMVANAAQQRVKYVIWNRQIWTPSQGWHRYSGPSPHTDHVHISYQ